MIKMNDSPFAAFENKSDLHFLRYTHILREKADLYAAAPFGGRSGRTLLYIEGVGDHIRVLQICKFGVTAERLSAFAFEAVLVGLCC